MKEAAVVLVAAVDLSVAAILVSIVVLSFWSYVRNRSLRLRVRRVKASPRLPPMEDDNE